MNIIDQGFIDEYVHNAKNELDFPKMGGTDWRFTETIAPAFKEILETVKPMCVLEFGFNVGASALMFLSIVPDLRYQSVDLNDSPKSVAFLKSKFEHFNLYIHDSSTFNYKGDGIMWAQYQMVFIDANHEYEAVIADIESALNFHPEYILFDDALHPSHSYIYNEIITKVYKDKLEVVKLFEFNNIWQGYSMCLCKVKY